MCIPDLALLSSVDCLKVMFSPPLPMGYPVPLVNGLPCEAHRLATRAAGQCWCDAPLLPGGFPVISLSAWWSSPWWSYLKILFPLLWFQTKLLHKQWDKGFNWLALAWGSVTGFGRCSWVMLVLCALAKANVIGKLTFPACQWYSVFLIKGYSLFN